MMDTRTEKNLAMILHLSFFLSGICPIVIPLILWLVKKDESQFINEHGKSVLNFQLTLALIGVGAVFFSLVTFGIGAFLIIPLCIILGIATIVFVILGTINASEGKLYKYPVSIQLIK